MYFALRQVLDLWRHHIAHDRALLNAPPAYNCSCVVQAIALLPRFGNTRSGTVRQPFKVKRALLALQVEDAPQRCHNVFLLPLREQCSGKILCSSFELPTYTNARRLSPRHSYGPSQLAYTTEHFFLALLLRPFWCIFDMS